MTLKLSVIARQFRVKFDHSVQRSGGTRAKWNLIGAVAKCPGTTQSAIASAIEVTEMTAGRLIDRLCADGYLERRENPSDRRGYCVYTTPAAQPLLQKMGEVAEILESEAFAGIDEKDLALLEKVLDAIGRNLAKPIEADLLARANEA